MLTSASGREPSRVHAGLDGQRPGCRGYSWDNCGRGRCLRASQGGRERDWPWPCGQRPVPPWVVCAAPGDAGNRAVGAGGQREDGAAAVVDRPGGHGGTGRLGAVGAGETRSAAVLAVGAEGIAADGPGGEADTGLVRGAGPRRVDDRGTAPDGPGAAAAPAVARDRRRARAGPDRKSTRLNSSHVEISYAVFCLKKKNENHTATATKLLAQEATY